MNYIEYHGFYICQELGGYTVLYCGDDIFFGTVQDAKQFIDQEADA